MAVAFIPLRGGSKSIPLKNIKILYGKPLAQWVIDTANSCEYVDRVVVSTDSQIIADSVKNCEIFWRSNQTSTDTATSESALIEFCKNGFGIYSDDIVAFIQATSPLLTSEELCRGIDLVKTNKFDSALSAVKQKRFVWDKDARPSYDLHKRPRRQDWDGYFVENGAFYISKVKDILFSKCRLSGSIGLIECSEESYYELDEPQDWNIIENLLRLKYQ
jgi:N-acylneuraminate cytidylyltransferase